MTHDTNTLTVDPAVLAQMIYRVYRLGVIDGLSGFYSTHPNALVNADHRKEYAIQAVVRAGELTSESVVDSDNQAMAIAAAVCEQIAKFQ